MTTKAGANDEARAEILRRVRESIGTPGDSPLIERRYSRSLPEGADAVALFAERVADYRATVSVIRPAALPQAIADSLDARQVRRIVVPSGLPSAWMAVAAVELVADEPPLTKEQLDQVDGVITACAVAIAETGTVVLDAGSGQGRRALSLLPDYHLCVVTWSQIYGTVPEAMERLDPRRPQTWISGPSATSDIELQRVEGVHGPRNLEVLIVED